MSILSDQNIIFSVKDLILETWNIYSDVKLAIHHFSNGNVGWGSLTIIFLLPFLIFFPYHYKYLLKNAWHDLKVLFGTMNEDEEDEESENVERLEKKDFYYSGLGEPQTLDVKANAFSAPRTLKHCAKIAFSRIHGRLMVKRGKIMNNYGDMNGIISLSMLQG